MPILYIMCGPSGCGKTTWADNFMRNNDEDIRYVSRDEIRFSIIKSDEPYFSHEDEVFKKFVGTIAQTLVYGFDVIADATHLNYFSRKKLTRAIDAVISDYKIIYVVFDNDVNGCIERNEHRIGRTRVPEEVIRSMCDNFEEPTWHEDPRVIDIIMIM